MSACSPNANGDMFMNFMDFSDDGCMNMFTTGQKKRMRAVFSAQGVRNSFLSSFACDSSLVKPVTIPLPEAAPVATATSPTCKIYPNPVCSFVTIELSASSFTQKGMVTIFNTEGKVVFNAALNKVKTSFNLEFLSSGFYIIKAGEGSNLFISRFIKQ